MRPSLQVIGIALRDAHTAQLANRRSRERIPKLSPLATQKKQAKTGKRSRKKAPVLDRLSAMLPKVGA
jgi:hypothetical protein